MGVMYRVILFSVRLFGCARVMLCLQDCVSSSPEMFAIPTPPRRKFWSTATPDHDAALTHRLSVCCSRGVFPTSVRLRCGLDGCVTSRNGPPGERKDKTLSHEEQEMTTLRQERESLVLGQKKMCLLVAEPACIFSSTHTSAVSVSIFIEPKEWFKFLAARGEHM